MIGVDSLWWIITFLQLNVGCEAFSLQTSCHASPRQRDITTRTVLSDTKHPISSSLSWSSKPKPFLAIITETDACNSKQRMEETFIAIKHALGEQNENNVDLISIRVICQEETEMNRKEFQERLIELTKRIMTLKQEDKDCKPRLEYKSCMVVVNDHFEAAIAANADGVHVKEKDTDNIPFIKEQFTKVTGRHQKDIVIGTSAHTMESALMNWKLYQPNYFFVGTCYLTQSHPEKDASDLEGPSLPGVIKRAINEKINAEEGSHEEPSLDERGRQPIIFAIGGIGADNCYEPVELGADGVAVIRSIMQAKNPGGVASQMIVAMS